MNKIETIMQMINSNSDKQTQEKGLELARQVKDWTIFVQPLYYGSHNTWENCAIILSEKSDNQLEPFIIPLLEWVEDLNWPGAEKILNRLVKFSPEKLYKPLEYCITRAIQTNKDIWLDYLSDLLNCKGLQELLSDNSVAILKNHYMNWHLEKI